MATRNRRNEWHQVHGRWTRSLGERGMRVRIFEKRRNGTFYRTTWVPGRGRDHASLGTRDRNEAERLGRMLLAELLRQEGTTRSERLTLGAFWKRYETECATYLDNKASTRRDDAARVKVLLAFFGEQCDARTLTARDQSAYAASRTDQDSWTPIPWRACAVSGSRTPRGLSLLGSSFSARGQRCRRCRRRQRNATLLIPNP